MSIVSHFRNEHDVDVPALAYFVSSFLPIVDSLLDVGAHYSHAHYAHDLRRILRSRRYDAIDIMPDETTAKIVDHYYVGNVLTENLPKYDCLIAISALEHCGITSYQVINPYEERDKVLQRIFELCGQVVFISVPFGQAGGVDGQYLNVTDADLQKFNRFARAAGFVNVEERFFLNQAPQEGLEWKEVTQQCASAVPVDSSRGIQCVAIVSWAMKWL